VAVTVTVVDCAIDLPLPVHVKVYVEVTVGLTTCVPDVAFVLDQAPEAVQEVTFVEDQVSVADPPEITDVGLAERVTVGAITPMLFTVTLTDPEVP